MRPWRAEFAMTWPEYSDFDRGGRAFGGERKADLPPAGEFDIDLREQLGIEQRAVEHAVAAIDSVTHAERVERMLGPRMAPACQHQRVDHPLERDLGMAAGAKLPVEE